MTPKALRAILKRFKKSPYDLACATAQGNKGKGYVTTATIYNFLRGKKIRKESLAKIVAGAKKL
jgi:hypothetical protein